MQNDELRPTLPAEDGVVTLYGPQPYDYLINQLQFDVSPRELFANDDEMLRYMFFNGRHLRIGLFVEPIPRSLTYRPHFEDARLRIDSTLGSHSTSTMLTALHELERIRERHRLVRAAVEDVTNISRWYWSGEDCMEWMSLPASIPDESDPSVLPKPEFDDDDLCLITLMPLNTIDCLMQCELCHKFFSAHALLCWLRQIPTCPHCVRFWHSRTYYRSHV